jgi:hypothetical protein
MNDISTCAICQTQKKQSKKYGLLPEKEAEAMPWDRLCIDLIGPYNIKSNVKGVKIPPLKQMHHYDQSGNRLVRDQTI